MKGGCRGGKEGSKGGIDVVKERCIGAKGAVIGVIIESHINRMKSNSS